MFRNIQTFSFANIDKYSTAGLVTRMTTDVTNIQNAYQMMLRMSVRAPASMIVALIMSYTINRRLANIYLIAVILLGCALAFIMSRSHQVLRRGIPQVRRPERERAGECLRHPRCQGLCAREV